MNFKLNVHIHVKFRAFGITFGTVDDVVSVSYNGKTFAWITGGAVPVGGTTTVYNNRGVLLEVWI